MQLIGVILRGAGAENASRRFNAEPDAKDGSKNGTLTLLILLLQVNFYFWIVQMRQKCTAKSW